jgi:hypothetical protein
MQAAADRNPPLPRSCGTPTTQSPTRLSNAAHLRFFEAEQVFQVLELSVAAVSPHPTQTPCLCASTTEQRTCVLVGAEPGPSPPAAVAYSDPQPPLSLPTAHCIPLILLSCAALRT